MHFRWQDTGSHHCDWVRRVRSVYRRIYSGVVWLKGTLCSDIGGDTPSVALRAAGDRVPLQGIKMPHRGLLVPSID